MKKIIMLLIAFAPFLAAAQKEVKPSVSKAENALRAGKFDEAKAIIDATVASTEFMADKKGNPSKNAAAAWYVRGLVYVSIDTTTDEKFKSLDPNPYKVAVESFDKSKEIDQGKSASFIKDPKSFLPILFPQITGKLANFYFTKSSEAYSKEKDYKKAFDNMEHAMYFSPTDTAMLLYAGVYFGPAAGELDKSIVYINKYIAEGGTNTDAVLQLISIYQDKKKDVDMALKTIKAARLKYPQNDEYPKYELNIYLAQKQYALARKIVQEEVKKTPKESSVYYMLGQLYDRTNNPDSAKISFQKAIDLDPSNFDANLELAQTYYAEGKKIKNQRDKLGISAAEITQRKILLEKQREEYKIALPYWEKCEKLKPEDDVVLYTLSDIYNSLVMDDQVARIEKKIKALGLDK